MHRAPSPASSFLYASARDFARLGLFFLRDGVWEGTRILPEGWVAYSLTPTKLSPGGEYGAHVWLKLPESVAGGKLPMPDDAYYMLGHDQQVVAVVPSRDLVIVRLGLTREDGDWDSARELAPIVERLSAHRAITQGDPAASARSTRGRAESSMPTVEPAAGPGPAAAAQRAASQPERRERRPEASPPPSSRRCSYWPTGRRARSRQSLSR